MSRVMIFEILAFFFGIHDSEVYRLVLVTLLRLGQDNWTRYSDLIRVRWPYMYNRHKTNPIFLFKIFLE